MTIKLQLLLIAILSTVVSAEFDEVLAKTKFFPLAAAAYTTFPVKCVKNVFDDAEVTKTVTAECGKMPGEWKVCYGFTGVSHTDKAIFLAYRGTISVLQLMYESARLGRLMNAGIGGKAAEYFYSVYQNIEKAGMNEEVARLRSQFPDYEVWVTGHSLGAALASVSAGELVKLKGVPSTKLKLITFGEPRTGNAQYARKFEKLVPYAFRVVNRKDTVPHMPPQNFLGYTHHSAEVWYENGMTDGGFKVCPTPEDKACSNRVVVGYNWQDHIRYYTKMILGYGIAGCGDFGDVTKRFWG